MRIIFMATGDIALPAFRHLMAEHGIAPENVSLHGETPGEQTLCPGRNIPRLAFRDAISLISKIRIPSGPK